jgi:hypothetical protein
MSGGTLKIAELRWYEAGGKGRGRINACFVSIMRVMKYPQDYESWMENIQTRKLNVTIRLEPLMNLEKITFIRLNFLHPQISPCKQRAGLMKNRLKISSGKFDDLVAELEHLSRITVCQQRSA